MIRSEIRDLYADFSDFDLKVERAQYEREASEAMNPTKHALAMEDVALFDALIADREARAAEDRRVQSFLSGLAI